MIFYTNRVVVKDSNHLYLSESYKKKLESFEIVCEKLHPFDRIKTNDQRKFLRVKSVNGSI